MALLYIVAYDVFENNNYFNLIENFSLFIFKTKSNLKNVFVAAVVVHVAEVVVVVVVVVDDDVVDVNIVVVSCYVYWILTITTIIIRVVMHFTWQIKWSWKQNTSGFYKPFF